jgi:hypothetical protein
MFFLINQKMRPILTHGRKEKTGSVLDTWGSRLSSIYPFIHPSIYIHLSIHSHPSTPAIHPSSIHSHPSTPAIHPSTSISIQLFIHPSTSVYSSASVGIHLHPKALHPSICSHLLTPSIHIHSHPFYHSHPSISNLHESI